MPTHSHHAYYVEPRYCVSCAGPLVMRVVKSGDPARAVCTVCGQVYYANPKVAAGVICTHGGRIVLLRRAIDPSYGKWVFPGGFLDHGEPVEDGARREAREEICVEVQVKSLLNVYSYPGNPVVLIVYKADVTNGVPQAGDEALEVGFFDPAEIPWGDLAFPSTRDALRDYIGRGSR